MDQGRSMKPKLDTGVEVYDNKVMKMKNQRHATIENPNIYLDVFDESQYFDL